MRTWALWLVLWCAIAGAATAAPRELTIFHLNDAHGYIFARVEKGETVGGFAMVAGALARGLAEAKARGSATLFLFGGDMFQGTTVVEATRGACMVEMFNRLKLDASCLGNHEFDYGPATLSARLSEARYPILATNVHTRLPPLQRVMRESVTLDVSGIKVGLVGATTVNTPGSNFPENVRDFTFLDAAQALPPVVRALKKDGARVVIALTHLGVADDKLLVRAAPELDLVVGGHSHTALEEPVFEGKTPIVQAGEYTRFLGEVRLALGDDGSTKLSSARLIRLVAPTAPSDPAVEKAVEAYLAPVARAMAEVVGELKVDLSQGMRGDDSPMAEMMADAMREAGNADIGLANRGGVRRSMFRGPVTMGALVEVVPFGNTLVTMDLSGAQVRALLERSLSGEWKSADTRPPEEVKHDPRPLVSGLVPGHRTVGMVQPAGLTLSFDPRRPEGSRIVDVRVAGKPLDDAKSYRVACTNYLASGGDGLSELTLGQNRKDSPLRDRDMLVRYLGKRRPLEHPLPVTMVNLANSYRPLTTAPAAH